MLDSSHSNKSHWNSAVANVRARLRSADDESARLVRELRHLRIPLNDMFRRVYTLSDPPLQPPPLDGSCPVTRKNQTVSFQSPDPEVVGVTKASAELSLELERNLAPCTDEVGRSWISYDAVSRESKEYRKWREQILNVLRYVVSGGIVELAISDEIMSEKDWSQLTLRSPYHFLVRAFDDEDGRSADVPVPRLTLLGEGSISRSDLEQVMAVDRPRHIIIAPRSAPDPRSLTRNIMDMVRHFSIDELLARLKS